MFEYFKPDNKKERRVVEEEEKVKKMRVWIRE